ncbi:hypothetical protein ACFE04_003031 [Oxalis oulophora]
MTTSRMLPKQPRKYRKPPSWEVITLVAANHLHPKSVAIASCVCKSWNFAMSSEDLWRQLCKIHFPNLIKAKEAVTGPPVPYRRLCAIAVSAASRINKPLPKPQISLKNIFFSIQVKRAKDNSPVLTLLRPCNSLFHRPGQFCFEIKTNGVKLELKEELRITWNVFLEGWGGVFTMMDSTLPDWSRVLRLRLRVATMKDFTLTHWSPWKSETSQKLPLAAGCCTFNCSSTISAFFGLFVRKKIKGIEVKEIKTKQVIVGIVDNRSWSFIDQQWIFLPVDESLRYLEYFLLPNV